MLETKFARSRQGRLLEGVRASSLDAVVIGASHHFYYLSAHRLFWLHEAALILFADGKSVAIVPSQTIQSETAAEEIVEFESPIFGTQRLDQPAGIAERVIEILQSRKARRIGVDASAVSSQVLLRWEGERSAIDPILWQMRRRKDPDELKLMRKAFACADAMYARAREVIEPGVDEIAVFAELNVAALREAGEPLSALLGNDYSVNAPGGPPKGGKRANAGEIYILDVGPAYRGYFSDAARCFAVGGKPTDEQMRVHAALNDCHLLARKMARPGVRCRDLFAAAEEHLKSAVGRGLTHHLGHGVGLFPHEYPHINPHWDDVLMEWDIFTIEPGIYGPDLRGGLRLENSYLVKADGIENLLTAPMAL